MTRAKSRKGYRVERMTQRPMRCGGYPHMLT